MSTCAPDRAGARQALDGETIAKSPSCVAHEIVERDVGPDTNVLELPAAVAVPAIANAPAEWARSLQERIGVEA